MRFVKSTEKEGTGSDVKLKPKYRDDSSAFCGRLMHELSSYSGGIISGIKASTLQFADVPGCRHVYIFR
jgi:hypothetical protein